MNYHSGRNGSYGYADPYAVRIKRKDYPTVSIYIVANAGPAFEKLSCIFCKRTIIESNVLPVGIITAPLPLEQFKTASEIQCSLCAQKYRLLEI